MYIELTEDGKPKRLKIWGVTYVKEKHSPLMSGGEPIPDAFERQSWGLKWERTREGYYHVSASLLGNRLYVGKTATWQAAARLYDSVLFHLWGFSLHARPRFNILRPCDVLTNPPAVTPQVVVLRKVLYAALDAWGVNGAAFDFTFAQDTDEQFIAARKSALNELPETAFTGSKLIIDKSLLKKDRYK